MFSQKWTARALQIAIMVAGTLLWPIATQAGELRLQSESFRFSDLDGSATDLDGSADGTLTLDRLELGGNAEIVVDRVTARITVEGDVELSGTSTIRPASDLQAQGSQVEVRGNNIRLLGNARIRADGASAGGRLRVCAKGKIEIAGHAELSADALDGAGPGGSVHVEAGQRLVLQDAAARVRANGGSGGSVTLVSCGTDAPGHSLHNAAIAIHGRIEALGATGAGGSVEVEARQGGVAFQRPILAIDAGGATAGSVSVTAASGVTPQQPPTRPAATVVTGSPSEVACDCLDSTGVGTLVVAADVDRTTGVPGTQFRLSGRVVQSTSPVEQWHWMLSDGRTFTGPTISVSFPAPGLYSAHLMATDQEGTVVHAETGVVVFDPATQAPPELGLPVQVGDIDSDGLITLRDAHRVAKHAGRLERLVDAAVPAGDVDLDGEVTSEDALLLGQAVAAGAPLPTVLLPDHGAPGTRVNLISPDLLDPTAVVEIEVGQAAWVQQPLRPARGYATFVIPFDATQRGTMRGAPGPVEVRIRSNGVVVDTLTFEVEAPPPLPANPKAELQALFDDYQELLALNQAAIEQVLELATVDGDERELLLAAFTVAEEGIAAKLANLRALLDQSGGDELAKLYFLYANANGYPEYRQRLTEFLATDAATLRATLQAMATAAAGPSVDDILRTLCIAKRASELLDTGGDILGWVCDGLLVAAIVAVAVPVDGPVVDAALLFTWAGGCGAVEAGLEMVLLINSLVGSIDPDLRFEASPTSPRQGEAVKLKAELEMAGIDDLCGFAVGQGRDELIEDLAEEAVERLLRKKLALRALSKAVELLSEDLLDELEDRLEVAVVRAVGDTEVANALEELANKVCGLLNLGVPLTDDLSRIMSGPDPNVGTLTFPGDGTADYTCLDSGSNSAATVTFTATRDLCGETAQKQVTVTCQNRPVTITMGDNGTANDDIYEVRVQGQTVLTSSAPVRSISTTVNLPVGDHVVEMIGRAAPDGIGTYFIRFSGATVIGGAPLSGTDLTPGVVKTFVIRVQ